MKEQRDKKSVDRERMEKEYETLGIRDRFIFSKVMTDKNLCIQVLRCLTGNDIEDIGDITAEKYFQITNDGKGVRYDVYVEDADDNAYDAEMQNYTYQAKKELMLRNRYYQSIIDNRMMESGMEYQELKDSYVIFICTFDPFGKGRRRYTFFNVCEEDKELYADDGRTILIFNTGGCLGDLSEEAKEFLDYVENGTISGSLSEALEEAVKYARHNKEWRSEYMMNMANYWDAKREGRAEGRNEGRTEGRTLEKANSLVNHIAKCMDNTGASLEDCLKMLGETMEDYLKAKEIVEREELFV